MAYFFSGAGWIRFLCIARRFKNGIHVHEQGKCRHANFGRLIVHVHFHLLRLFVHFGTVSPT